jgi:endonuclease/exonuclease/phosphatase family metal-dependent hydrolase
VSYQLVTDDDALLDVLRLLDFDVLAVQEIIEPAAFGAVLERLNAETGRRYEAVFAQNEAGNPQHVGVVADANRARIAWAEEHVEVDVKGTLRPGLSARIESVRDGGIDFTVMSLHLASGSSASRAELRAQQAAAAAAVVARQITQTADGDYLVLGDLNTAREQDEFGGLDAAFAAGTSLVREPNASGCSSYWIKKSTNPLLRPSWLDHAYRASLDELDTEVPIVAGAHCAERLCQAFESTDPQSGSTFYDVSDHCPVYFEVRDADEDALAPGVP